MTELRLIDAPPKLPPRPADGHKGTFGKVLVAGGSAGMPGAVALAVHACQRGGAGLVRFAVPAPIQQTVAGLCVCATSVALPADDAGRAANAAVGAMLDQLSQHDVLALGPGMDRGTGPEMLVRAALAQDKPLVLDADGLSNLATIDDWPALRRCPLILTPHPGEFARLTGSSIGDVQADRQAMAIDAASQWASAGQSDAPLVLVLKGAGTVVTDGQSVYVNGTGNPGMATAGAGDVLTGLTAALWAGPMESPLDAACLAAWAHGRAGDLAADRLGETSVMATDILDELPAALQEARE